MSSALLFAAEVVKVNHPDRFIAFVVYGASSGIAALLWIIFFGGKR